MSVRAILCCRSHSFPGNCKPVARTDLSLYPSLIYRTRGLGNTSVASMHSFCGKWGTALGKEQENNKKRIDGGIAYAFVGGK